MPLDTCITNVGEYYSSHYLDSTFVKDVKELVKEWNAAGSQSPPRKLHSLSQYYFRAKTQALDEDKPLRRQLGGEEVRGWHAHLLQALGYTDLQAFDAPVEGAKAFVPVLGRVNRYNKPWLLICETHFCLPDGSLKEGMPSEDPLGMLPYPDQLQAQADHPLCAGDWSRGIGRLFTEDDAPRWVLFLAGSQVLLLDRNTYAQGRYLAFDLDDAFGRRERDTFNHIAAFLAAETLSPGGESDEVLLDKLEEQSHRFAHGVTENLQFAVREAIELLVNEWAYDRTERQKRALLRLRPEELRANGKPVQTDLPQLDDGSYEITAEHLKREALVFVYRLLFCFYAEARGGELEILPIDEDTYRLGYSLESLRDLEQVPLTAATESGTYFHEHVKKLFQLIHQGFHPHQDTAQRSLEFPVRTFTMRPLTATLFAPDSTPLLNRARLSNRCLQAVIRRLSLSSSEKSRTIGRVNYAELGINQLGAVYEGLLSYKGRFADQDLIHVKPAKGDFRDKKTATWLVPRERLDEFKKDEVERLPDGKARIYTRGTFILHLNGIDREQSASYYTPEVLTRCLVEEALRELLKDYAPEDADRILELKICEPAMGSGAFLNEAAEQLAHRYLELKQKQLGQTIEPVHYGDELRRVKHYITTRNVYGVDLNATAVELGSLSLWLGSIHRLLQTHGENGGRDTYQPGATPWFGLRLRCGNSLIGARRAVWTTEQLLKGKHGGKNSEVPRLLKPGEQRGTDEVYHFLVFDEDMLPTHSDKLMRSFWPERCAAAKKWIAQQVKPKWNQEEVQDALEICDLIDQRWEEYAGQRATALEETTCTATVWPTPSNSEEATAPGPTLEHQEKIKAELESTSGSFQRLKLIMDTWCALWFWPLDRVTDLPTREGFLASARLLLGAEPPDVSLRSLLSARLGFQINTLLAASKDEVPNTETLIDAVPWFAVASYLSTSEQFHHWQLIFPEILGLTPSCHGFNLVIGNPPWQKAGWSDIVSLSEIDPILGVRQVTSSEASQQRSTLLSDRLARDFFVGQLILTVGAISVLSSSRIYPLTAGTNTNIYRNFLTQSWGLLASDGIGALIHEEGVFEDPRGASLRKAYYSRLRAHYRFINELQLFPEVGHNKYFSLNVYSATPGAIGFHNMSNLFHPRTIAESLHHQEGDSPVPGIKTAEGQWNLRGHKQRVTLLTRKAFELFTALFGEEDAIPETANLPNIHSTQILTVLEKFTHWPKRLKHSKEYKALTMFSEKSGQEEGLITQQNSPSFQPHNTAEWIISGPHFFVSTPLFRTPRTVCRTKNAYDEIDHTEIADDFLPRATFRPGNRNGDTTAFESAVPKWPDDAEGNAVTSRYRYINRFWVRPTNERTMIPAIIPPGSTHIQLGYSIIFRDERLAVIFCGGNSSICIDFLVKTTGKEHVIGNTVAMLPILEGPYIPSLVNRTLRLNCLTGHYDTLWMKYACEEVYEDRWTSSDPRLCGWLESPWSEIRSKRWDTRTPVRSPYARRQALLEIDVLVALTLGFTLDELISMYHIHFPTFQLYENADEYDSLGQRLPNTVRKNAGSQEVRKARADWDQTSPLQVSWEIDAGLQTVTKTFYPPFTGVDREADYARAYEIFQQRYGDGA